jgi:hypothetical protein
MTEDEFREMERRMAINRGEIESDQQIFNRVKQRIDHAVLSLAPPVEWPEHMIEAECTRLLEMDGWRAISTKPVSDRGRGVGFGEVGMADHLYLRYEPVNPGEEMDSFSADTQTLWIEFKSAKGKPAKHQIEWHTKERARGALTLIAGVDFPANVAGFVEWYRRSGLDRGRV